MVLANVKFKLIHRLTAWAFLLLSLVTTNSLAEPFDFSVDTDKGVVTTESLKGQLVYIDFWASWCVPCRKSFPWMNEMQAKYKDKNFRVLAINLDKDRALAEEFLEEFPADFQIGYDPSGALAEKFKVIAMPMAFLMNRQGEIVTKHTGFKLSKTDEYESSLVTLLEQQQ